MAIFHMSVKTISRSAKRSATAAAAYCTGTRIVDERSGLEFDYTRKGGIEPSALIIAPPEAPDWASDRSTLWNVVEQTETRKNSTVAREYIVALPEELDVEARRKLARSFAQEIVDQFGCVADVAIHRPSTWGDNRNHHAHILCSTRKIEAEGFTAKTRELDDMKTGAVAQLRELWANLVNAALGRHMVVARVDHRSHEARGLDILPTIHEGVVANEMARRGEQSDRVAHNDEIRALNAELLKIAAERKDLEVAILRMIAEAEREVVPAFVSEKPLAVEPVAIKEPVVVKPPTVVSKAVNVPAVLKGAEVSRQQLGAAPQAQEKTVAEPVQVSPPVETSRSIVPSPAVTKKPKVPSVPPRDPVETEFIEFLKGLPFQEATEYVRNLPNLSKWEGTVTAREVFNEIPGVGGEPGPGRIWDEAKWAKQRLEGRKAVTEAELEKALAANKGWFGQQKKDTPEILEMKKKIADFHLDIGKKALAIEECEKLWSVEEPRCQQVADERNAKRQLNRRFGPFVAAGKFYVQQVQQQMQNEPKPLERSHSPDRGQGR